ncbi:hypothetical protein D3C72_2383160 [compost metagenome]
MHVFGRDDEDGGAQTVLHLGVGEDDPRIRLLHDPAGAGQILGQQVADRQLAEVFDIRR